MLYLKEICLNNISNVFLYAYKSAQETNLRLYQNDGNSIIFFSETK